MLYSVDWSSSGSWSWKRAVTVRRPDHPQMMRVEILG